MLQDLLARQSDVTVSSNVTLYTEYRGFFMYVLCTLALTLFVIWILAPEWLLDHVGISYYPDKYWAQAIPSYLLMLMLYAYVMLTLYNIEIRTLRLDDIRAFTDDQAVYPLQPLDYVWKAPSGVWDLPIGLVNEVLYT